MLDIIGIGWIPIAVIKQPERPGNILFKYYLLESQKLEPPAKKQDLVSNFPLVWAAETYIRSGLKICCPFSLTSLNLHF